MIQALHQVLVDPAGPVLADLVGELLAVAGRAAGIDRDDGIPRRGEHLVVPAVVPLVVPGPLRSAVDQEDDRVFLARLESRRAEQPAVDLVAVGPGKVKPSSLGRSSWESRGALWWVNWVRPEPSGAATNTSAGVAAL